MASSVKLISRSLKFKVSLRKIGVYYEKVREETLAAENEKRAEELSGERLSDSFLAL